MKIENILVRARKSFFDRLPEWVIRGLFASGILVVLLKSGVSGIAHEWHCVRQPWCQVSGQSVSAAIALLLMSAGLLAWLIPFYWRHRKREFKPFDVVDELFDIKWIVREAPRGWLQKRYSGPFALAQVLDGPLHATDGCNERLSVDKDRILDPCCPSCRRILFNCKHGYETPSDHDLTSAAFAELERMDRTGIRIKGPRVVLQRPRYWEAIEELSPEECPYDDPADYEIP